MRKLIHIMHEPINNCSGYSNFADLNSVKIYRNRISLGVPMDIGTRMSENTVSVKYPAE